MKAYELSEECRDESKKRQSTSIPRPMAVLLCPSHSNFINRLVSSHSVLGLYEHFPIILQIPDSKNIYYCCFCDITLPFEFRLGRKQLPCSSILKAYPQQAESRLV